MPKVPNLKAATLKAHFGYYPRRRGQGVQRRFCLSVCLSVCLFFHTISQKPLQLGPSN